MSAFTDPVIVALIERAKKLTPAEKAAAFVLFLGRLSFDDDPTSGRRRWCAGLVEKSIDDVAP